VGWSGGSGGTDAPRFTGAEGEKPVIGLEGLALPRVPPFQFLKRNFRGSGKAIETDRQGDTPKGAPGQMEWPRARPALPSSGQLRSSDSVIRGVRVNPASA